MAVLVVPSKQSSRVTAFGPCGGRSHKRIVAWVCGDARDHEALCSCAAAAEAESRRIQSARADSIGGVFAKGVRKGSVSFAATSS